MCGKEISEVFETVPKRDYVDSIWFDIENADEEIEENLPEEYRTLIEKALGSYQSDVECVKDDNVHDFADYMLRNIKEKGRIIWSICLKQSV